MLSCRAPGLGLICDAESELVNHTLKLVGAAHCHWMLEVKLQWLRSRGSSAVMSGSLNGKVKG